MKAAVSLDDLVARGLVGVDEAPALLPVQEASRKRVPGVMERAISDS